MIKSIPPIAKACALFVLLAAAIIGIHFIGLDSIFDTVLPDKAFMDTYIRGHGLWGYGVFLMAAGLWTSVPLPRQMVSVLAGYAFGVEAGFAVAMLGSILGCILTFSWARLVAQGYIMRRYGHRIHKVNAFLAHNPFTMALIIRCIPTGSNFIINVAAGISHIPAKPFFAGSCIGYAPQTFIFALLGSGIDVDPVWRTSLSAVLFFMSTAIFGVIFRRYKLASSGGSPVA
ncbi:MAG: VTT domain-containing protein [Pseudomonadota bacterium]